MKFSITTIAYLAALTVSAVNGLALATSPAPALELRDPQKWCHRVGEPCAKIKRAAEAIAEAFPHPDMSPEMIVRCYGAGGACNIAKREALALAEAVAEAHAVADLEDRGIPKWCNRVGEPCAKKEKREADIEDRGIPKWCHRVGEPCAKAKRAAEAIAEALAEPAEEEKRDTDTADGVHKWCYRVGEPCAKAKRGVDALAAAMGI